MAHRKNIGPARRKNTRIGPRSESKSLDLLIAVATCGRCSAVIAQHATVIQVMALIHKCIEGMCRLFMALYSRSVNQLMFISEIRWPADRKSEA